MAQAELEGQDRKVYLDTTPPTGTRQELENIATTAGLDLNHPDNRAWLNRILAMGVSATTMDILLRQSRGR